MTTRLFSGLKNLALVPYGNHIEHFDNNNDNNANNNDNNNNANNNANNNNANNNNANSELMENFRGGRGGGRRGGGRRGGGMRGGGGRRGGGMRGGGRRGGFRRGGRRSWRGGFRRGKKWYSPRYANRYYYYNGYPSATGYYDHYDINYSPWGINIFDYPLDYYYDPWLQDYSTYGVADSPYPYRDVNYPLIEGSASAPSEDVSPQGRGQWTYLLLALLVIMGIYYLLK